MAKASHSTGDVKTKLVVEDAVTPALLQQYVDNAPVLPKAGLVSSIKHAMLAVKAKLR
jgi:hypothetical protein